jgi:hypothetical protein
MKNSLRSLLVALPVAAVAAGCLNERTYVDPDSAGRFQGSTPANVELQNGRLSGDFGPRQGFDGAATEMAGTSDRAFATSTTTIARSENGRGTGMIILWTDGVVLEQLEVGAHDFSYDPTALEAGPLSVNVCSGGDSSSIDYDAPVETGSVVVTRTPEGRVFDVHTETRALDEMGNTTGALDVADAQFTILN